MNGAMAATTRAQVGQFPPPMPVDNGEIGIALNNLNDAVRRLDHLTESIAGRLSSITLPSSPKIEDVPNRRVFCTDLGNHINEQVVYACNIADRLEDLINRIGL